MIPAGIYKILSNEEYHADKAISRSGIKAYRESPYKYWAEYINPDRPAKKTTPAMEFGTAFHTFVLEPEEFDKRYAIEPIYQKKPEKLLLKNVGRPAFEKCKEEIARIDFENDLLEQGYDVECEHKNKMSRSDLQLLCEMNEAIIDYDEARKLIRDAFYELSYFWKDPASGLMLKARPDILHEHMIVDLKTCAKADSKAYQRTMAAEGYHLQGEIISQGIEVLEGRRVRNVLNICVEKEYPYEIGIKVISENALDQAAAEIKKILERMKYSFENNSWPRYEIDEIDLPSWY